MHNCAQPQPGGRARLNFIRRVLSLVMSQAERGGLIKPLWGTINIRLWGAVVEMVLC